MAQSAWQGFSGFALVGALGFLVDATLLAVLFHGFGVDQYTARVFSFTAAVTTTWRLNRTWVFKRTDSRGKGREYTSYFLVQAIGAAINLSVFVLAIELVPLLASAPTLPLALGAAVALLFNFGAASRIVFASREHETIEG